MNNAFGFGVAVMVGLSAWYEPGQVPVQLDRGDDQAVSDNCQRVEAICSRDGVALADETSRLKVTTKRDSDRVEVNSVKGTATLVVRSPVGISGAVVERTGASWPETMVVRLRLSGLERFKVSNGKIAIEAAVSSTDRTVRVWKDGNEHMLLTPASPYWLAVSMVDSEGQTAKSIPLKDGYFEIELPKKLLADDSKGISLNWIDFYRN